ncbi:hypothetical protein [Sphingomonas sp. LM7]|uniref:hypothetical protein n=1 Tax=Sphingomonas sp. LM7 TaxID=1938607 RepID=UPI000983AD61|nr:hypothetical protein [Sphingomonas sp. LM7]AQR72834.1 hypothetical protein BXU08_03315 [Sphingomonas sp. LM7]
MRGWTYLLGGLIVWAVHFFALYFLASVFLTTPLARGLTLLVTVLCLAAAALLLVRIRRSDAATQLDGWMRAVALYGTGLSIVAILWQALPALLI